MKTAELDSKFQLLSRKKKILLDKWNVDIPDIVRGIAEPENTSGARLNPDGGATMIFSSKNSKIKEVLGSALSPQAMNLLVIRFVSVRGEAMDMMMKLKVGVVIMALVTIAGVATAKESELTVVDSVELDRYLGVWYEIASYPAWFQRNCTAVSADYSLRDDGLIKVVNSCRKGSLDGKLKQANGRAKVVDTETNAKLKVSFFGPFWGNYWIIDLDPEYQWVVVGEPKRKYLWILSRTRSMDDEIYGQILARLPDKGYDPSGLQRTVQPDPQAESNGASK